MKNPIRIAAILPNGKYDYLADTVLDGLAELRRSGEPLDIFLPNQPYPVPVSKQFPKLSKGEFIASARAADLILVLGCHHGAPEYAENIGLWDKTVVVDGSELGKNRRLDPDIVRQVKEGTYPGPGRVEADLLRRSALYFRRERPYPPGVLPLPFGIESKYVKYLDQVKDIDFVCIFGQEDYPPLRREVRLALEAFCRRHGFSFRTRQTRSLFSNIYSEASRRRFYRTLARAKVGISVSGGGFDTVRFWEILGNGCLLLTEKVEIFEEGSRALDYQRIYEFEGLDGFLRKLALVGKHLRDGYDQAALADEYGRILSEHSTKARAASILNAAAAKGIIRAHE